MDQALWDIFKTMIKGKFVTLNTFISKHKRMRKRIKFPVQVTRKRTRIKQKPTQGIK